jgi:hypothetical protein
VKNARREAKKLFAAAVSHAARLCGVTADDE